MKQDLDRLMDERNLDALVVEGPDGYDAANPDYNYFVKSEHVNGVVIKKRGQPPLLVYHPWEQVQARATGLELIANAEEPPFKTVRIGLGANGPERMLLTDLIDNRTEWRFSGWKRNPKLSDAQFRFVPPPGVDVVGEPVKGAEVKPLQ